MKENKILAYLTKHEQWSESLMEIRQVLLKTELTETVKWGMPVYTINGKNVVGISGFKYHFGLWFYQGIFLQDKKNILVNAQEGKTKAMRHMRFSEVGSLDKKLILSYIKEAIQNAKDGKEVKPESQKIQMPRVLKDALKNNPDLKLKFGNFTTARQKEFFDYIGSAKRESTQLSRLEKSIVLINKGETPNDKYRN